MPSLTVEDHIRKNEHTAFNVRPCLWQQLHLHAVNHVTCAKPLPYFF